MKTKLILFFVILLNLAFLFPSTSYASPYNKICASGSLTDARNVNGSTLCSDSPSTDPIAGPNGIIAKINNIVTTVAGVAAVIMIIISGLLFVTAGGDPKRVETARNTIIFSIVGLVVIVLARFIIEFVVGKIT